MSALLKPRYAAYADDSTVLAGNEYQDWVMLALIPYGLIVQVFASQKYQYERGESAGGCEIKFDRLCTRTQRLSIEVAEKSSPLIQRWTASGIHRNDNSWLYATGNYDVLFVFGRNILRLLHASGRYQEHETPTVKGFYLPLEDARRYASLVLTPGQVAG